MNVDHILQTLNEHRVAYLLIGGMNFLLRHAPIHTYDIDIWIDDNDENRGRCEQALAALSCEWGLSDDDWGPVAERAPGWLARQSMYCLYSRHGAIDVFRHVHGLSDWQTANTCAAEETTGSGIPYRGLSDRDMLECQLALEESERNARRVEILREALSKRKGSHDQ